MTNSPNPAKSPLELARQGDPAAIAALIKQSFQRQGLRVEVRANYHTLEVSIYGKQPPSQQCVKTLQSGLEQLGIHQFTHLMVDAYQQDLYFPAWVETVTLAVASPGTPESPQPRPSSKTAVTYQSQWQALKRHLPPWLRDPKLFAVIFIGGLICLVFKPLIFIGMALAIGCVGWLRLRRHPQSVSPWWSQLPPWGQQFLTGLAPFQWEWLLALWGLYCWVLQVTWLSYFAIAGSIFAIAKIFYSILQTRGDRDAPLFANVCLIANLHGLLLVLHSAIALPVLPATAVTQLGIILGIGLVMQLGYYLRSAALVAHVLLTLSLLLLLSTKFGPGLYTNFDRPYYDTGGYGFVFGLYMGVAIALYFGAIVLSSLALWGFGRGVARNDRVGYACLLISPYLAWAYVLTKLAESQ